MSEVTKMFTNAKIEPELCYTGSSIEEGYFFTPEKQLELIKWMIKTNHRYFIQDLIIEDFPETLAGVFNLYWQDLTNAEKQQIQGILE